MTDGGSSGSAASGLGAPPRPPFALILSITLTGIMGNTLITPALPDIQQAFGVGVSAGGLILAATAAPGIVMAPIIGVLSDRYGRREIVVPCLILFGLAGGMSSFASTFSELLVLRFLQGVGAAGLINLAVSIIGDHWEGVDRARMIGRNAAALTASIVVLPPIGGLLADWGGWEATFYPYWLSLGTAALIWLRLPRSQRGTATVADQLRETAPFLRQPQLLGTVTVGLIAFAIIFGLFLTVNPLYLEDEFGLSASGRGLILALPAVTSTVAALSLGRLKARYGLKLLSVTAFALWAVAFGVIAAVPTLAAVCVGALIYGLGEGLVIPTLQDSVVGSAPASSRGAVVALFVGFARAGQTAGPAGAGPLYDQLGARGAFAIGAAAAVGLAAVQPRLLREPGEDGPPGGEAVLTTAEPGSGPES